MSGRPKPGQGGEAERLAGLIHEAHGVLRDIRTENRTAREITAELQKMREALAAELAGIELAAAARSKTAFDDMMREMEARRDSLIRAMGRTIPCRTSCSWCGAEQVGLVDLSQTEVERECPECGEVTVITIVEKSRREKIEYILKDMDRQLRNLDEKGLNPAAIVSAAWGRTNKAVRGVPPMIPSEIRKRS